MYYSIQDNEGNWLASGSNSINKRDAINDALALQLDQIDGLADYKKVAAIIEFPDKYSDKQAENMLGNFGLEVVEHAVKNLDYDFDDDTY